MLIAIALQATTAAVITAENANQRASRPTKILDGTVHLRYDVHFMFLSRGRSKTMTKT